MSVRQETLTNPRTGKVSKRWRVDVQVELPNGQSIRKKKVSPVQTKRGAESYERQLRVELFAGTHDQEQEVRKSLLLATYSEEFMENYAVANNKPATVDTRRAMFSEEFMENYAVANNKPATVDTRRAMLRNHLLPAFGELRLDAIGPREIEAYKAGKLKEGLSSKTVNNQLAVLSRMLVIAKRWGLLATVPDFQWLKVPEPKFDFFDFDEADRFRDSALDEEDWQAMMVLGIKTGLRQGELLGLPWDAVDLVAGKLVVRQAVSRGRLGTPKNGKSREVPLSGMAVSALKRHRHLRGEFVFCNSDGSMLTKGQCKWPLWRACKRAGLRRIGWHVLRHSFASHLVMNGEPLKAVQELLGHSTIKMTERYAHLSPDVRRDAVERLDRQRPHSGHFPEQQYKQL